MRKAIAPRFSFALKAKTKADILSHTMQCVNDVIDSTKILQQSFSNEISDEEYDTKFTENFKLLAQNFDHNLTLAIDNLSLEHKLYSLVIFGSNLELVTQYCNYYRLCILPTNFQSELLKVAAIYFSTFLEKNLRYDQNYNNQELEYTLISEKTTPLSLKDNEIAFKITENNKLQCFVQDLSNYIIIEDANIDVVSFDYFPMDQETYNQIFSAVKYNAFRNLSPKVKEKVLSYINQHSIISFSAQELEDLNNYYITTVTPIYQEIGYAMINEIQRINDLSPINTEIYLNLWAQLEIQNNTSNYSQALLFEMIKNATAHTYPGEFVADDEYEYRPDHSDICEKKELQLLIPSLAAHNNICDAIASMTGCLALILEEDFLV